MRIDKYLKLSRVIKRRVVANELCDNNKVFVNDNLVKAHYEVKINDVIKIYYGDNVISHIIEKIPYEKKSKK